MGLFNWLMKGMGFEGDEENSAPDKTEPRKEKKKKRQRGTRRNEQFHK